MRGQMVMAETQRSNSVSKGPRLEKTSTGDLKRKDKTKIRTLVGDFDRMKETPARKLKVDKGERPTVGQRIGNFIVTATSKSGGGQFEVWGVPINTTERKKSKKTIAEGD